MYWFTATVVGGFTAGCAESTGEKRLTLPWSSNASTLYEYVAPFTRVGSRYELALALQIEVVKLYAQVPHVERKT